MEKAIVLNPDFSVRVMDISQEDTFLSQMQEAVEGLIQPIDYNDELTLWVNEEFYSLKEPKRNLVASTFYQLLGGKGDLLGTAVFTGATDEDGKVLGLSDEAFKALMEVINEGAKEEYGELVD